MKQYNDAELALIGNLIIHPDRTADAFARLTPEMFESEELAALFRGCAALGQQIDVAPLLEKVGGEYKTLILSCVDSVVTDAGGDRYIALVYDAWRRRELRRELDEARFGLDGAGATARETTRSLMQIVNRQMELERGEDESTASEFCECAADFFDSLSRDNDTVKTGFVMMDYMLGGFQRGGVYVVSARAGKGKSDFCINLATNIAKKNRVLYCTMEMPRRQVFARIISRMARIDSTRIRDHKITEDEKVMIAETSSRLTRELSLTVDEQQRITVEDVEAKILRYTPDIVFLDHLGLMNHRVGRRQMWEALTETTKRLKELALRHNIVIVELVQQSRTADTRKGKPELAELKGSSSIEADADGVMMIEAKHDGSFITNEQSIEATVYVRKNRHGMAGNLTFKWQPQYHAWFTVM